MGSQSNERILALLRFRPSAPVTITARLSNNWPMAIATLSAAVWRSSIYLETLQEIERDGYRVLDRRITLTPIRKLWLAWKTVRQEKSRWQRLRKTASA